MISLELFKTYVWGFMFLGWLGTAIIAIASIREVINMFKGVK